MHLELDRVALRTRLPSWPLLTPQVRTRGPFSSEGGRKLPAPAQFAWGPRRERERARPADPELLAVVPPDYAISILVVILVAPRGQNLPANFASGAVLGVQVGIGVPGANCPQQPCQVVRGQLLRNDSPHVVSSNISLDRPRSLLVWTSRSTTAPTEEHRNGPIDARLAHVDMGKQNGCLQAPIVEYKVD